MVKRIQIPEARVTEHIGKGRPRTLNFSHFLEGDGNSLIDIIRKTQFCCLLAIFAVDRAIHLFSLFFEKLV